MYIDPNTGGMLFQVLATVFALFSGLILIFSGKIRAFIARARRSAREGRGDEQTDQSETVLPSEDEDSTI
jgi:hypothetical protein